MVPVMSEIRSGSLRELARPQEVVQVEVYVQVDESSGHPQHATLMERISFREVPVGDCRRRCCENLRMCPGSKDQSNISVSGWELEEVGHLEVGLVSLGVARRGFVSRMKCQRTLMEREKAGPCQNGSWARCARHCAQVTSFPVRQI